MSRMGERCASCRYPLCVTDSVTCNECSSHFHIDCAQLVGYPYYELSSEPSRNTFQCNTCRLLPLPVGDRDSDDEDAMPSRQLDCRLDPQGQDLHELRASVLDLHDLFKDLLREINDLKSINLTLRCSIETLRHDNGERDALIGELRRRLEALEGRSLGTVTDASGWPEDQDAVGARGVHFERYSTPEPELGKVQFEVIPPNSTHHYEREEREYQEQDRLSDSTLVQKEDVADDEESEMGMLQDEFIEETEEASGSSPCRGEDQELSIQHEADVVTNTDEKWSWRDNEAIEERQTPKYQSTSDQKANYNPEAKQREIQKWQSLDEDIESQVSDLEDRLFKSRVYSADEALSSEEESDQEEDDDSRERDKQEVNRTKRELPVVEEGYELDTELLSKKHVDESHEDSDAVSEVGEGAEDSLLAEGEDKEHPDSEVEVEGAELTEGEHRLEEGEVGEVGEEAESRLEGDHEVLEGETHLEDEELREAETEGEPSIDAGLEEVTEESEVQPVEPPPPIHTEEDLWDYLKETVTSVHPSTVEEFVQNLIGTLQHVPEEYLKPVIDANIKRTTSPSLTDGEHLTTPEEVHLEEGELNLTESSVPTETIPDGEEGAALPAEVGLEPALPEPNTGGPEPAEWSPEAPQEAAPDPEAEGYSVVEAAA